MDRCLLVSARDRSDRSSRDMAAGGCVRESGSSSKSTGLKRSTEDTVELEYDRRAAAGAPPTTAARDVVDGRLEGGWCVAAGNDAPESSG